MKKLYTYTALALIVILGSYQLVMARPGKGNGDGPPPDEKRMPISFVQELKLTDDQVSKITALIQTKNTNCAVLEDKMQENKKKMELLQWSKDFSQEKVDAIIKEIKDTMTQLMLNHEKLNVDIKAQLTLEQVQIFNKLQMGKGKGPGNGRGPGRG